MLLHRHRERSTGREFAVFSRRVGLGSSLCSARRAYRPLASPSCRMDPAQKTQLQPGSNVFCHPETRPLCSLTGHRCLRCTSPCLQHRLHIADRPQCPASSLGRLCRSPRYWPRAAIPVASRCWPSLHTQTGEGTAIFRKERKKNKLRSKESLTWDRPIAQAVSRRFHNSARSEFAPRSVHVGFVVDKVLGQVFSEYFGFPCQFSLHWLLKPHRLSSGRYYRPVSSTRTKWTQSHPTPINLKKCLTA
jgi:hypothetical protein